MGLSPTVRTFRIMLEGFARGGDASRVTGGGAAGLGRVPLAYFGDYLESLWGLISMDGTLDLLCTPLVRSQASARSSRATFGLWFHAVQARDGPR